MTERENADFITAFEKYCSTTSSPELFQKWAGICAVAGLLERKVWINTVIAPLYPNMYCIIIGHPGVGKTVLTSRVHKLWKSVKGCYVAASSLTTASLIDELVKCTRTLIKPQLTPSTITYNSLHISINELGILIEEYSSSFMTKLTELYDCHPYSERRRSKDIDYDIESPQINIFAGGTPGFFVKTIPDIAWDQGFLSRTILVYSGDKKIVDLFAKSEHNLELEKSLQADAKKIDKLYGAMVFAPDAQDAFKAWHMADGPPIPTHPKLAHYCSRRSSHLLKLCMVACVSRTDELIITMQDYQTALAWFLEVETAMPDLFKAMSSGGSVRVMEEAYHYMLQLWLKNKKNPVPEKYLIMFLAEKIPVHEVVNVAKMMVTGNMLKLTYVKSVKSYEPVMKEII